MSLKLRYLLTPLALPILMAGVSIGLTTLTTPAPPSAAPPTYQLASATVGKATKGSKESKESSRGYLGVSCQRLTRSLREVLEIPDDVSGVLISDVAEGSAAERAGLKNRDVVLRMNGTSIDDERDFTTRIREAGAGTRTTFAIWRGGKNLDLSATLDAAPKGRRDYNWSWSSDDDGEGSLRIHRRLRDLEGLAERAPTPPTPPTPPMPPRKPLELYFSNLGDRGRLGVQLQELNDEIADYFSAPGGKGALIWQVMEDSPAQKAGLKAGDVIVEVEGDSIGDVDDLHEALGDHDSGDKVAITVLRRGQSMTVTATLDDGPLEFGSNRMLRLENLPRGGGFFRTPGPGIDREDGPSLERIQRQIELLQSRLDQMRQKLDKLKD